MPTLLLRLCGPMQSWGTRSRFTERDTELEPSKSGVIGLLCAALGRSRAEPVDDLARLRMGVRVDREGILTRDYHTAGGARDGVRRADGSISKDAVLSNRYYLADADFLVGLEGDDETLLAALDAALRAPRWQLFLGRKSLPPSLPVHLPEGGIREAGLKTALQSEPWPFRPAAAGSDGQRRPRIRCVFEREPGATREVRMDQPVAAAYQTRVFGLRWVETSYLPEEG